MNKLITLLFFLSIVFQGFAQDHVCGSDHVHNQLLQANPSLKTERELQEIKMLEQAGAKQKNEDVLIIPVVFHVIHEYGNENISKQTILDAVEQLNHDFRKTNADTSKIREVFKHLAADSKIEFRLATKNPQGNCTDGIVRVNSSLTIDANDNVKSLSNWNSHRYLNIWVVRNINLGMNLPPGQVVAGYAYFPGTAGSSIDGIVIGAQFVGKNRRTLTHEVGHYLNLYHTFQGGCGTSNCNTTGDRLCDTPPAAGPNHGCNLNLNTCASNPLPDMIENYMDYSNCQFMFTHDQKNRMRLAIQNHRSTLVSQSNLEATGTEQLYPNLVCKPVADFRASSTNACFFMPINFFDESFNGEPATYSWSFPGGTPSHSADKAPSVYYAEPGVYPVSLTVSNQTGTDSITRSNYITVQSSNFQAPFAENFQEDGQNGDGWRFSPSIGSVFWQRSENAAAFGDYSLYLNNYNATINNKYEFEIPGVNVSKMLSPHIMFKYAYAQRNANSRDTLRVIVSGNCGNTWLMRYMRHSTGLSTAPAQLTPFVPGIDDWKQEIISLNMFSGSTKIMIKFEFTSGGGNDIYIDDIIISGEPNSSNFSEAKNEASLFIHPNPASDKFTLNLNAPAPSQAAIYIFDVMGREISNHQNLKLSEGVNVLEFSSNQLNLTQDGIYLVRVNMGNNTITQRLIIRK